MEHNIILKLRKMIAHKESAEAIGSKAEAEAFAHRIQEFLTKHKLSISDVEAKEEEEKGVSSGLAVDPSRFGMKDKDAMIPWLFRLAKTIASVNDCELLVSPIIKQSRSKKLRLFHEMFKQKATNRFIFVGVEADRVVAEEFYVYMAKLVWELAKKAGDDKREDFRLEILAELGRCAAGHISAKCHNYRHSFCKGFVDAVAQRLTAERERQKATAAASQNQETGLMLIDRRALMVRTYMEKNTVGLTKPDFYGAGKGMEGYGLGFAHGKKVALTSKVVEAK